MSEQEKNYYELGMSILDELVGEQKEDYVKMLDSLHEGVGQEVVERIYGKMYGNQEHLDLKTRLLVNVALMLGNAAPEQLGFHIQSALKGGNTREEIAEVMLQSSMVIGLPKALMALKILREMPAEKTGE